MTTLCEGCNEPTEHSYSAAYGGDWYSSCSICEWHCEQESSEQTTIKQGLTLEELVAHKKRLNDLMTMIHNYAFTPDSCRSSITEGNLMDMMDELGEIKRELLNTEE